jgi:Fic family protein
MKKIRSITKNIESKKVLKKLASTHRALAELKGISASIPNQAILINTLGLQEAKDSSAIENIITTHDEIYKAGLHIGEMASLEAKEVQNYIGALKKGFQLISNHNILNINSIIEIQSVLEKNNAGFRKVPGTVLKNTRTGMTVYSPPQDYQTILSLMGDLEKFINNEPKSDIDPLVKMSIIHHQFESIHPFYDGNGRTGRIINVLYLILCGLLDSPILYLSRFIINKKDNYYRLLQETRNNDNWENWILYMLDGVEKTSRETFKLIREIRELMFEYKYVLRDNYKFYSQDLLNNLFKHPYTKIAFIEADLNVSRVTAANYLNRLAKDGLLKKERLGTGNYYVNEKLFSLLTKCLPI